MFVRFKSITLAIKNGYILFSYNTKNKYREFVHIFN